MDRRTELVVLMARHLAAGTLGSTKAVPALAELLQSDEAPPPFEDLLEALRDEKTPALGRLREQLLEQRLQHARDVHTCLRTRGPSAAYRWPDLAGFPLPPVGWSDRKRIAEIVRPLVRSVRHHAFVSGWEQPLPGLQAEIEADIAKRQEALAKLPPSWALLLPGEDAWPSELAGVLEDLHAEWDAAVDAAIEAANAPPDADVPADVLAESIASRFDQAAGDRPRLQRVLDAALTWPSDEIAPVLAALPLEPWAQERGGVVLEMRFGRRSFTSWGDWKKWLAAEGRRRIGDRGKLKGIREEYVDELLLLWYSGRKDAPAQTREVVEARARARASACDPEDIASAWGRRMAAQELDLLLGREPVEEAPVPQGPAAPAPAPQESAALVPAKETPPPAVGPEPEERPSGRHERRGAKAAPSLWRDNIQPFLVENWYLVVGLAMVVVGASLLAYFTWDKHWVLRYTIMPSVLALFTLGLGTTGVRLARRAIELRPTGVMLRGAALILIPVNLMTLVLLCRDPSAAQRALATSLAGGAYAAFFFWAIRRWCRSIHPALATIHGGALFSLNLLLGIVPVTVLAGIEGTDLAPTLLVGALYLGFGILAFSSIWFVRFHLSAVMLRERVVPWFLGLTLALTFVEVFALMHLSLRVLPVPATYALMTVAAGAVVIFMERRFYRLRGASPHYGGESFLGYAFILLGVLMGMTSPYVRVAVLLLAGVAWLFQASLRGGTIQYWIGLTLLMLGGAAVGLLDEFPKGADLNLLPAIGLVMAAAFRILQTFARRCGRDRLAATVRAFTPGILVLTAVVSVLSQWHYRSDPWQIAAVLVVSAGLLGWRAERQGADVWVYTTAALLALALPYAGCADMRGHLLYGNTMVFGLAILGIAWLIFLATRPRNPWLRARSSVLLVYSALALGAMVLRVLVEEPQIASPSSLQSTLDLLGPLLMAAVTVWASYYSRSLVPVAVGAVIAAVIFPELKTAVEHALPFVTFGSGLGSASAGLALVLLTFLVARLRFLRDLGPGDELFGQGQFPFQRRDHTLFTWPLIATALFLTAKVDTHNLMKNYFSQGIGVKTAVALGLTSISWILLATTIRARAFSALAVNVGWITCLMCFSFLNDKLFETPQAQMPLLFTALALTALHVLSTALARRRPWMTDVLATPARSALSAGSIVLGAGIAVALFLGVPPGELHWLSLVVLAQLAWHALRTRSPLYGTVLFAVALTSLVAWTSPGGGPLLGRIRVATTVTPVLIFALAILGVHVILEWSVKAYERLKAILQPFHAGAAALVLVMTVFALWDQIAPAAGSLSALQLVATLAALAMLARAHFSGELAAVTAGFAYVLVHRGALKGLGSVGARVDILASPWRMALGALAGASAAQAGHWLAGVSPRLLKGRFSLGVEGNGGRRCIFPIAGGVALVATLYHVVDPALRGQAVQVPAPYLATAALCVIAVAAHSALAAIAATAALCIGNVQLVHFYANDFLVARGLAFEHVVCLGLLFSMVQGALAHALIRRDDIRWALRTGMLGLAGGILVLLSMHYFTHPDLTAVTLERFALSGIMSLAAGLYFRWAARRSETTGEPHVAVLEGLYHFGLTVASWCFALMIPQLRSPATALVALGLPPLYFYLRAEIGMLGGDDQAPPAARRYCLSSTVLCFTLLVMYAFRAAVHLVMFPDQPVTTDYYHWNAPLAMILGLVLLRLRGLGSTGWAATYGGLALAVGTYFGVTAYPRLSPFEAPVAGAWAAVLIAHAFIVLWSQSSPVRGAFQRITRLGNEAWAALANVWAHVFVWAATVAVVAGLAGRGADSRAVAPLLAATASLFAHQGIRARFTPYIALAGILGAAALHADFLLNSYLPREQVVWAVLALWAVLVGGDALWRRWAPRSTLAGLGALLFAMVFCHVLYHRPWSGAGLVAMFLAGVLWASTRRDDRRPQSGFEVFGAALLLAWGPWLVYFSQVRATGNGAQGLLDAWPVLAGVASLLATGALARACQTRWATAVEHLEISSARGVHQTLTWLTARGREVNRVLLWATPAIAWAVLGAFYERGLAGGAMLLCAAVWVGAAAAWFVEGRDRSSAFAHTIMHLCVASLVVFLRRQLMLHVNWWTQEYDVWFALAASAGFAGAGHWINAQRRELRLPLLGTQFVLPLVALSWTLVHGLGTDLTLVVLGINSLIFAYLGRGNRTSKCHIVSVGGFVAFLVVLFWQRLDLHFAQAYVIPVGVGLLVLLQLFGAGMDKGARNGIRFVVLLAMLASAGWYAILDERYPVWFNLTMLLLCLATMGVGSLLRVRLYLVLGAAGALVDLASLAYKVVVRLERTYQMTIIGMLLLMLGAAIVAGSVYYKTRRESVELALAKLRERLGVWD